MVGLQSLNIVIVDLLVVLEQKVLPLQLVIIEVLLLLEFYLNIVFGLLQKLDLHIFLGYLNGVVLVDHGYLGI